MQMSGAGHIGKKIGFRGWSHDAVLWGILYGDLSLAFCTPWVLVMLPLLDDLAIT